MARLQRARLPPGRSRSGVRRTADRLRVAREAASPWWDFRRVVFVGLCLTAFVALCAAMWPVLRTHLQALEVLDLVSGQPVPWMISRTVAEPVGTEDIFFPTEEGVIRARLFLPQRHRNGPPLLVFHGMHHLGIDEPRLMSFAAAMASCGLRVMTPELPDIKDYHVDQNSVRVIGESARWLGSVTGQPVGVMGLSFSGGLALVAAADPLYKPDFKFVFAVGSQDSMSRVAQFYRTGQDVRPNGTVERLPAHEYGPLVLEYEHLEDFIPPADVPAVRRVLRAHLYEDATGEAEALGRLSVSQRAEATRLLDTNSPGTRSRIEASTRLHAAELAGLSPRGRLRLMTTPVYLLHGAADTIIPSAETLWMASELPQETLRAVLVSPVLSHLDLNTAAPSAWDEWELVHLFALVLQESERST